MSFRQVRPKFVLNAQCHNSNSIFTQWCIFPLMNVCKLYNRQSVYYIEAATVIVNNNHDMTLVTSM